MEKEEIFEEIIDRGRTHGRLTYAEINEAFPPENFSISDVEELMDLLGDAGVEVTGDQEPGIIDEAILPADDQEGNDRTEDIVQTYFHSMGNISILTRDEEVEIAKGIEAGKSIIKKIVRELPLYKTIEAGLNGSNGFEGEEITEAALELTLKALGNLISDMRLADGKIEKYGDLKGLKRIINEKKKRYINPARLNAVAKEVHNEYKRVESEAGIKIDELKTTWDRIMRAKTLVMKAKNELIVRNLRLVINIAKNYIGRGLSLLDLIQEGNIGLMKAVDKFKYDKGFKFSTYATWWIRQAITRALIDQTKTIRVPVHMMEFYNKVIRASRELTQQFGREPGREEIAQKLGVRATKVAEVFRAIQDPIALQTPLDDDDSKLEDLVSDKDSPSPYYDAEKNMVTEQIVRVLNTLSQREADIIRMRFGIGFEKDYTLEEIGSHFSITRERVRQIEAKALRKLKHPNRRRALQVLID